MLSIRVEQTTKDRIEAQAEARGVSSGSLARKLLDEIFGSTASQIEALVAEADRKLAIVTERYETMKKLQNAIDEADLVIIRQENVMQKQNGALLGAIGGRT